MNGPSALVLDATLLSDRWHGVGDWPPSPFRLFQALVAGAYGGRWAAEESRDETDRVFAWFERLRPPIIIAPVRERAPAAVNLYVPNNDLDVKGGDPRNAAAIKTLKSVKSTQLGDERTIRYVWEIAEGERNLAEQLIELSLRLHLFGRGVDAAYAFGATMTVEEALATAEPRARVIRPSTGSANGHTSFDTLLPCPTDGSLKSLHDRFAQSRQRFVRTRVGRRTETAFRQPPKAISRGIVYGRPPTIVLFDILRESDDSFAPVRLTSASTFAKSVRDVLAARLAVGFGDSLDVERVVVGRATDDRDRDRRAQIIPLPSIGSTHTNMAIRRIAIALSPDTPISPDDVRWALTAQRFPYFHARLAISTSSDMLYRYGAGSSRAESASWQSVTPVVVPARVGRRGVGRVADDDAAVRRVVDAIRHARLDARPISVAVQREPFFRRGAPATAFDADRFGATRLAHVAIVFDRAIAGPLVLGDGRWLGLGVFAARRDREGDAPVGIDTSMSDAEEAVDDEDGASE